MKKLLSVLAVLFVLGTTSVFAKGSTGIGAQFGFPLGGALTFKVKSAPCVFAADIGIGDYTQVGLTADWWIANPTITGTWHYFYGPGVYAGLGLGGDSMSIGIGPRLMAGTNIYLLDNFFELYAQIGWQPTFWIGASNNHGGAGFDFLNIPVNLGFRFWF